MDCLWVVSWDVAAYVDVPEGCLMHANMKDIKETYLFLFASK